MRKITISAYQIPCDRPESDGTIEWDSTTLVLIEIHSNKKIGVGFTYGNEGAIDIIKGAFSSLLKESDLFDIPYIHHKMVDLVRNIGLPGVAAHAISAVDIALWDLKAKVLELPLCALWGRWRDKVPIYGSGGFTSYSSEQTARQFQKWKKLGINKFKMKIGRQPKEDVRRVKLAREAIGKAPELFVDANGAYTRKEALQLGEQFSQYGVTWFEEPVSADDVEGLHLLRNHLRMNIAAGEYCYSIYDSRHLLNNQSVDVLQADATRCCGFTGFMEACSLSKGFNVPLSSHTAPSIHLHACLSQHNVCHMEFFHDHVRIEETYFEGFPKIKEGCLYPHLDRVGHGLELKKEKIKKYLIREENL